MSKFMMTLAAVAFTLTAGAVFAQETITQTAVGHPGPGDVTAQQEASRVGHSAGTATWSAYARNIGPASTTSGYANDELGGPDSGIDHVPGAPAAGRADN